MNCETCRWFDADPKPHEQIGLCRKCPPQMLPTPEAPSVWPEVTSEDWCGQWEEKIDVPSENAPRRDQID